jgi:hypothetical protein
VNAYRVAEGEKTFNDRLRLCGNHVGGILLIRNRGKWQHGHWTCGVGFAPSATFGQWVSALARTYVISGERALLEI